MSPNFQDTGQRGWFGFYENFRILEKVLAKLLKFLCRSHWLERFWLSRVGRSANGWFSRFRAKLNIFFPDFQGSGMRVRSMRDKIFRGKWSAVAECAKTLCAQNEIPYMACIELSGSAIIFRLRLARSTYQTAGFGLEMQELSSKLELERRLKSLFFIPRY